jgi:hypothetical protein
MRGHDWTLPLFGWASLSVMLGLSTAKRLDWSDGWLGNTFLLLTLAPVAAFVLLLLVSATGCGVMIAVEWVGERWRTRNDIGDTKAGDDVGEKLHG